MLNFLKQFVLAIKFWILEAILPYQCVGCNQVGNLFCSNCQRQTTLAIDKCIVCQKPSWQGFTHPKCQTRYTPDRLITFFAYQNRAIKTLIGLTKLNFISNAIQVLAQASSNRIKILTNHDFVLCPVPLSDYKLRFRGFNQSLIIAKVLNKNFEWPIAQIVAKKLFIKQQKFLNQTDRQANIKEAFLPTQELIQSPPNTVIIVDDIITSGSTFKAISKVLKKNGVQIVWCLALAQD
ncbi:MAG: phosphoribosyltransferase family protein [Candidatus Doudnabacteria bacterium]